VLLEHGHLLFACAAWKRFALPLDPIADPDTWGYLSPALRKLIGAEFGHTSGRNFIYPGFLFLDKENPPLLVGWRGYFG